MCSPRNTMGTPIGTSEKKTRRDHIAGKHVREKTDGQREDAGQVTDEFDGNHQRRQRGHGSGKVFEVTDASVLESLGLVIR